MRGALLAGMALLGCGGRTVLEIDRPDAEPAADTAAPLEPPELDASGVDAETSDGGGFQPNVSDASLPSVDAQSCLPELHCGDQSCCDRRMVPGGTFPMGTSDENATLSEDWPEHQTTVSTFWLDTYEVTVGRFRTFVASYDGSPPAEGAGAHPRIADSGWRAAWNEHLPASREALVASLACSTTNSNWTAEPGIGEDHPMNCLTWYVAFSFCVFDGGRLPTEAEWEYAAAGGEEERSFPWGEESPHELLANCSMGAASPRVSVGSTPAGAARWEHQDLAGNLWEWVLDFKVPYTTDPRVDYAYLSGGELRGLRGGGWRCAVEPLRTTFRGALNPDRANDELGVRCAR